MYYSMATQYAESKYWRYIGGLLPLAHATIATESDWLNAQISYQLAFGEAAS